MKSFSIVLFLLVSCVSSFAQEQSELKNTSQFVELLKKKSAETQSIAADFVEDKYLSYLKEPQKSDGEFYYQKEDQLRWAIKKPNSYIILINKDKVRIEENGKEKNVAAAGQMVSKIKDLLLSLVKGDFHSNKEFTPQYFESNAEYIVKLTPNHKRLKNVFSNIELHFDKKKLVLNQLIFLEKGGDKSIMTFSNQRINSTIQPAIFTQF